MRARRWIAVGLAFAGLTGAACSGDGGSSSADDPGNCLVVDVASSPEKIDLMADLAQQFNEADEHRVGGRCIYVRARAKASGGAATALADGWDATIDGPQPVIWTPAGSTWGQVLNERLRQAGKPAMVGDAEAFTLSPLVIAMPEPMATAMGHPNTPIGWSDILRLSQEPEGWAAYGHPEWGPFRLGKTNPNFSTSGANALVAQAGAATGKTSGLSLEDLNRPDVTAFAAAVESTVVHYGDTTLTFLNNLYRADQRGAAMSYVSAVAIEEKSVVDYNVGNPDGVLQPGEQPRPPRVPLVAIYPKEGTLFSDSPLYLVDAPWVDDNEVEGAQHFIDFLLRPENQERVLDYHFRPANPAVAIGSPLVPENGVDTSQPQTLLEIPRPEVMVGLLDRWDSQRKKARVALVVDVSGSMGYEADPKDPSIGSKLDLAKDAVIAALELFHPDDEVSLHVFTTDLFGQPGQTMAELVPMGRVAAVRETMASRLRGLFPENGTPLYEVTETAYRAMLDSYDPSRINAVVVLTDGRNDDGRPDDDERQAEQLLDALRSGNEGVASRPVRVFPIGYGTDADINALRQIAEAANSAVYEASNAKSIGAVLTAVISNF